MTINAALALNRSVKPSQYEDDLLVCWLGELDQSLYIDVLSWHKNAPERPALYKPDTDRETELLAPSPYDCIYPLWLSAKIDFNNAEFDRYNNDMLAFNEAWQRYADFVNRANPADKTTVVQL